MASHRRLDRGNDCSSNAAIVIDNVFFVVTMVLFAVVLLMAAVKTVTICIDRRRRRRLGEQGDSIEKPDIESLPVFDYQSKNCNLQGLECAVCLSEFEENDKGRMLPACKHCFHRECIDMWLHSHWTCPLCRTAAQPIMKLDVHQG